MGVRTFGRSGIPEQAAAFFFLSLHISLLLNCGSPLRRSQTLELSVERLKYGAGFGQLRQEVCDVVMHRNCRHLIGHRLPRL